MKTNDINRMIDEMIDNRKKTVNMLLGKALDQTVPETWSYLTSDQVEKLAEKFADLLIKECANFIDSHEQVDKYGEAYEIVTGNDLRKHFGVEE